MKGRKLLGLLVVLLVAFTLVLTSTCVVRAEETESEDRTASQYRYDPYSSYYITGKQSSIKRKAKFSRMIVR